MRKTALALFSICLLSLMVLIALVIPSVFSQIELDVTYELTCEVTGTTTLWDPGTHNFEMTCEGQLYAPFADTFTMNGSGTATYSMVGGGYPPGEFDLTIDMSGYLNNSFFNGPFTLSAVAHGETVLVSSTQGFIRTEEVQSLSANGTFNDLTWNVTSQIATVDFSFIDELGKAFQFRVTGTSHTSIIPEFTSFIAIPLFIIVTLLAVIAYRRKLYER